MKVHINNDISCNTLGWNFIYQYSPSTRQHIPTDKSFAWKANKIWNISWKKVTCKVDQMCSCITLDWHHWYTFQLGAPATKYMCIWHVLLMNFTQHNPAVHNEKESLVCGRYFICKSTLFHQSAFCLRALAMLASRRDFRFLSFSFDSICLASCHER